LAVSPDNFLVGWQACEHYGKFMTSHIEPDACGIRLGFISSRAMNVTPSGIWMEPGTGRLVDVLHENYPHMKIAMSDHGTEPTFFNTYHTAFDPKDVIALPKITSLPNGLKKRRACRQALEQMQNQSDILMIQLPFDSPFALRGVRLPTLYHACADLSSVARSSRFRGPLRLAAKLAAFTIDSLFAKLINAKSARLVANGQELFEKYGTPRGKWVVSSVVSEREISAVTRQRPKDAPFRVLYVGYLRRWKGLDILISAFRNLRQEVPNSELWIVGSPDLQEQATADALHKQAHDLEQQNLVRFVGHVPFGQDLFQHFADADVFVLPSRGVEGTPRVLIEARAFGCPVIATDVGGIRSSIDHEVDGLIIPPNDVEACSAALLRIARDGPLRLNLIEHGLKRVQKCTVEGYAAEIMNELRLLPLETRATEGAQSC
jgi:glycosyltransferase involved in cell wall biosynthesis